MRLGIIIPCFRENDILAQRLQAVKDHMYFPSQLEVIVSDSAYSNEAEAICRTAGVLYIHAGIVGRAAQMNIGASHTQADILFFCHADSTPPEHFDLLIMEAIRKGAQSGCFRLKFESESRFLRFFAWFTRFKWRIARGGDQGLFVNATLYTALGGYNEALRIMEDVDMCNRLMKCSTFRILPARMSTSARKYKAIGTVRLQLIFASIHLLYAFGASQPTLMKFYSRCISHAASNTDAC